MSDIVIFQEKKQHLSEIPFIKYSLTQSKIREIKDSSELSRQITLWITATSNICGIKEAISDFNKKDIVSMILTKYKSLSIDELYYAFKMERYGNLVSKIKDMPNITKHYQSFDCAYISTVFDKYRSWKQKQMIEHNIHKKPEPMPSKTETEKQYWINRGVSTCLDYFEKHRHIEIGKVFVYEILYDDGYLSKDPEYKRRMYSEAQEVLRFEYSDKRASSKQEKIEIKNTLAGIEQKANGKVISKAKELVLNSFFRELTADKEKLIQFRKRYFYIKREN